MTRPAVALVLGTSTGGVGAHVRSLADGLAGLGWPVLVCGPVATDELFGFSAIGARFQAVHIAGLAHDPLATLALRRAVRGVGVVHAHGLRAGTVAALARRRPLVVTWHNAVLGGPGLRRSVLAAGERFVARSATVTLAASPDLADRARRLGGQDVRFAPVASVHRSPARAAAEVRAELGVPAGRPLIVSVGRLHPQKGHDVLIEAAIGWAAQVVIAGDGPLHDQLAAQIARTAAPVRLLGRRDDIPDLLAAADLVVLASRWEARSLAVQEALALGRPVVTTRVGGTAELVGDAAVLVEPGDAAALHAAVRALLADPDARAALGARASAQPARWPTVTDTVAQVEALYRELIGVAR